MFLNLDPLKSDLTKLAGILNQFKSELVQTKLVEMFFSGGGVPSAPADAPRRKGRPPGSGKKAAAAAVGAPKVAGKRRARGKMGATGALNALIKQGYFKTRRTIADVVEACEAKVGVAIKVTNLSGPLARFVQEGRLNRAKNKEDKYEYWAK
ncbi:hypothetical protein DES53_11141 [Roseimicrobium gellanilyticum]|uniref:Uncharacterized protein n=1 Tax=Roseimicrobium gellanilyticum TaxID=748857 RepID=A0A366H8T8_9BACT|nr:hypothetical protein [Roseimicrobium gellanilyticum]RBP38523.1 hypothetical protein DES53_11141 [Roseimicrobium gellanilyticum]